MASENSAVKRESHKERDSMNKVRKLQTKKRQLDRKESVDSGKTARRVHAPDDSYLTPPSEGIYNTVSVLRKASRGAMTLGPLFSYSLKSKKKINRAKVKARSEIGLYEWGKFGYHSIYWGTRPGVDRVPRINYDMTSRQEFIEKFERPNIPVIICGLTKLWPAHVHWNVEHLLENYGNQKFKIGEDDDGDNVYLKLKHFFPYSEHEATLDDSPLYVFDSAFSKNLYFKQDKPSPPEDERMGLPKATLLNDFFLPKYFDIDLFNLTGSRRPPHRWLVMGGARSGTHIHIDPLGTSAWNALVKGHKRWAIFPPNTPLWLIDPPRAKGEGEGITWFAKVFPKFLFPVTVSSSLRIDQFGDSNLDPTLGQAVGMIEVLQRPGETIFVPGGWSHVVVNLDFTIAITQNFCSPANLEYVYLKSRFSRPKLAAKLLSQLNNLASSAQSELPSPYNYHPPSFYRSLVESIQSLRYVPALYTSSENSSSSSSSSSDSESES